MQVEDEEVDGVLKREERMTKGRHKKQDTKRTHTYTHTHRQGKVKKRG